ncbi:MAG: hypothetical protein LBH03_07455 [Holophagales bacterium]|nr:hypothetical protein [Holophagales bacterium]
MQNANGFSASGYVVPESKNDNLNSIFEGARELWQLIEQQDRFHLSTLDEFIFENPNNHIARTLYCLEAAKYLPDEVLENKIFENTKITRIAPSYEAYSKMINKEKWFRLISGTIIEGLINLRNSSIGYSNNPWQRLSDWEDLDVSSNFIDWHTFFKETEFWYDAMYYVQKNVMPEVVFIKLIRQTDIARDWETVRNACLSRFQEKKSCTNEWILGVWIKAEMMLNIQ